MSRSEYDANRDMRPTPRHREMPKRRSDWLSWQALCTYALFAALGVLMAWRM